MGSAFMHQVNRTRMAATLFWLVVVVAAAYLLIVSTLFAAQRSLLFQPADDAESPAAMGVAEMRTVTVRTADGLDLLAWYGAPRQPDAPVIAYFHGNAGTIAQRAFKARLFLDAGYGVLLMEYRGYGGNPGRPSEAGLYEDGRAALRWLESQGVPPQRLIVYGESLGTGVAVQLAVEARPAALILEAPYTSIPDVAAGLYPLVPVRLLARDRFDSLAKIADLQAPLLVVHGHSDQVVPFSLGKRLFEAAPQPKQAVFLPQANHGNLYDWGAGGAILAFLRQTAAAEAIRR